MGPAAGPDAEGRAARAVRRKARLAACAAAVWAGGCAAGRAPAQERLVDLRGVAAGIAIDIRYAAADNFTRRVLYPVGRCLLRESVAKRLALVQADLAAQGLGLKVWDCYRPLSIQRELWSLVPDPRFVADPKKGSRHNRGAAVDATLVDRSGRELEMPTGFDDFTPKAFRDNPDASPAAVENRRRLADAMAAHGFEGLKTEWWHFDAKGWRDYAVLDAPLEPGPAGPPER